MKTSARNELTGKITNIIEGAVMSEVKITVSPEITISATVTKEGLYSLGAKLNDNITAIVKASGKLNDTKLNALPSTGGIGTTIFTIAGCVIMIAAAGLFFASRKKSDNK